MFFVLKWIYSAFIFQSKKAKTTDEKKGLGPRNATSVLEEELRCPHPVF